MVGTPQGVIGWLPSGEAPSPPPCGWSTGFMAVPRVCGRTPMWRLRPALPTVTFWWSALPTTPTVARQSARTMRISPEGRRSVAMSPSLAISWMLEPAERASWPPRPELDVVHERADGHRGQRHRVADGDVLADAGDDGHTDAQPVG